jgi:hypothetical protein
MRFSVCVNHGSTLELRTTLTEVARGANAAAEAGSSCGGIEELLWGYSNEVSIERLIAAKESRSGGVWGGEAREVQVREIKARMKEEMNCRIWMAVPRTGIKVAP